LSIGSSSCQDEFAQPFGVWEGVGKFGVGGRWVLGADGIGSVRVGRRGWSCIQAGLKTGAYKRLGGCGRRRCCGNGRSCGCRRRQSGDTSRRARGMERSRRSQGIRSAVEGVDGLGPAAVVVVVAGEVVAFLVEGLEEELGDVGEGAGVAAVHASGGDVGEEFAEDEIDGDGILEIATEVEEFGADFGGGLELEKFAVMQEAEVSGGVVGEHATAAAVSELEDAAIFGVVGGARFFAAHVRLVSLKLRPAAGSGAMCLRLS